MRLGKAAAPLVSCLGNRQLRRSCARRFSLVRDAPVVYVSECQHPYINLAFEDWLYKRSEPAHVLLLMYRNTPSVILGRNQNPWKELNMARLRDLDIPFVRRRSGGGTVYHDLGNTNYSIMSPRASFQRRTGADMITRALRKLGIPAYVNERHDICVEQYKVSGSAFKIGSSRAYHHGTMLIDAHLQDLRGVLRNTRTGLQTKGVESVSSPVRNLEEWSALIDHNAFVNGVAAEFAFHHPDAGRDPHTVTEQDMLSVDEVARGAAELQSWDWLYGQTPEFTHDLSHAFDFGNLELHIASRHGIITDVRVSCTGSDDAAIAVCSTLETLTGDRYGTLERTLAETQDASPAIREALQWLMREM